MDKGRNILVIEDEAKLARFVELELKYEGYEVEVAYNGKDGIETFFKNDHDLILLDLMLPELNGLEVCRKIRKINAKVPIIMLTAKDEVIDKVVGLDSGADDYVSKPFAIEEVLARMRAAFKRVDTPNENKNILKVKNLTIDLSRRQVKFDDENIDLTKTEYDLLTYMVQNKNIVLTRERILNQVWGYEYIGETNIVDVYIRYLRTKIDDKRNVKFIHTIRGVGYFVKEED